MTLFAGTAKVDLSPATSLQLHGYPHVRRISEGVHDPILASAICLKNDGATLLLLALDLLMLDPPFARRLRHEIASELGIPEAAVFISCTHTHSAPVTSQIAVWEGDIAQPEPDMAYLDLVRNKTLEAAIQARAALQPATHGWTSAHVTGVGTNRLDPEGPIDRNAGVFCVRNQDDTLVGAALVYGMHPTVMHEDSRLISADFLHYTRQHLREQFGDQLVVCCHNAPCGNLSPRYSVSAQTFTEAERLGRRLGAAVTESIRSLVPEAFSSDCRLASKLTAVDPPRRQLPDSADARQKLADARAHYQELQRKKAGHGPIRTAECAVFGAEGLVKLAEAKTTGALDKLIAQCAPYDIQALYIGEGVLVGVPGEYFVEYALEFKRRTPDHSYLVALVNGHLQGYIVTAQAAAEGGYEAAGALFAPETGEVTIDAAVKLATHDFPEHGR